MCYGGPCKNIAFRHLYQVWLIMECTYVRASVQRAVRTKHKKYNWIVIIAYCSLRISRNCPEFMRGVISMPSKKPNEILKNKAKILNFASGLLGKLAFSSSIFNFNGWHFKLRLCCGVFFFVLSIILLNS